MSVLQLQIIIIIPCSDNVFESHQLCIMVSESEHITMKLFTVDVGGSAVKYGVCDEKGTLTDTGSIPLPSSFSEFLEQIGSLAANYSVDGIAVSSPGAVNCSTGVVGGRSAVPWIHNVPVVESLNQVTGLPAAIENDANCAALGELWIGAAKDFSDCCFVIFGTGIGGAVIKDRKIYTGSRELAGEFGLMIIDYAFETNSFHVWSHYSTNHIVRSAEEECHLPAGSLDGITVFEEASSNPVYAKHVDRFYQAAANGILNLQQIYDPEAILLGGGISARPELCEEIMKRIYTRTIFDSFVFQPPQLRICEFGNQANLIGAAYHYLRAHS